MPGDLPTISKAELFARLAEGHAAGVTVLTSNLRLAQELAREFDAGQAAKGLTVWETADILMFDKFVERLHEDARYSDQGAEIPVLLTLPQAQVLWESILAGSGLLSIPETATGCAQGWTLAHEWRIDGALDKFPGNEDAHAFAGWAREYSRRCAEQNAVDRARLPDLVLKALQKKPKLLIAFGFDPLKPQQMDFLSQCRNSGIEVRSCDAPGKRASSQARIGFISSREELAAAARWARARLQAGAKRIGVVVPALEERRKEVARVFSAVMQPGFNQPGAERRPLPFDISFGQALSDYPIVRTALSILQVSMRDVPFAGASQLIRSAFIHDAESEREARARLDARLRRTLPAKVTLPKLIAEVASCKGLRDCLERLFAAAKVDTGRIESPGFWAQRFTALLEAAGFPGERALVSEEFQAREKINAMLGELARLDWVAPRITMSEALRRLAWFCDETQFQPETPDTPIQVLGIFESRGLEFDCLWVTGLTGDAWPLAVHPNPFLPIALQKKAGIPEASAESTFALNRRITDGWLAAANEVVFSWPEKEDDRDLSPSPLIAQVPPGMVEVLETSNWRDLIFESRASETIADGKAPPLTVREIKGGTRVLSDQAACPFRAFARHRLGAEALEAPAEGLDAMQRGQLLHTLMAEIWKEVRTKEGLALDLSGVIARSARKAVQELEIEGRFAELEQERLEKLAVEWLEVERGRDAFEVIHSEEKVKIEIGGITLSGRIDRMDKLADGTHVLIDYKTGARLTPRMWMGERPDEPQLPLYSVSAKEEVSAVAFARLRKGEARFMGYARAHDGIPGMTAYADWDSLFSGWKSILAALAAGYAAGDARVDPKDGLATCRDCDLQPLCRVHERFSSLQEAQTGTEDS